MADLARFPPLPAVPEPPHDLVDPRQSAFGTLAERLGGALEGGRGRVGTINVTTGYPASAVNVGRLQEVLEAALARFDMPQVRDRWNEDLFLWTRAVLLTWIQRCKFVHFDLDDERAIHIELQTQDDLGYYGYTFDVFPGRAGR